MEMPRTIQRELTPFEQVEASPVARVIADVLAHTQLAEPDGSCESSAHWSDPDVLQATNRILNRLETEGFIIVPKP